MIKKAEKENQEMQRVDEVPAEIVTVEQPTILQSLVRAEVDVQISTAKKYPRSIARFRQKALTMVTSDQGVAMQCFYILPRGGKKIEGPSVRLAEIVACSWGNMRFGARIIDETDKEVVAQGIAHDLETNVCTTIEVSRRITNKEGVRFNADMISVTKNAASSIALRNAIFKTIPFAYVKPLLDQAKKTAVGSVRTLKARRSDMMNKFFDMKVKEDVILTFLKKENIEDVGIAEIETLIGVYNAIQSGELNINEAFGIKTKADAPAITKKGDAPPIAKKGEEGYIPPFGE